MDKWEGKFAVITGALSGIGAAITEKFIQNGINVIALDKNDKDISMFSDFKGKVYVHKCDISSCESIAESFKWIEEKFDTINILVNNAGMAIGNNILDVSDETTIGINQVIDTNFRGHVHVTRKAVALMKKNSNHSIVINICSILGHKIPYHGFSFNIYPPTKYALRAFNEIVRQELMIEKNEKIRTSCISPGLVNTPLPSKDLLENQPHIEPEDIADAAVYILSTPPRVNILDMIVQPAHNL